MLFTLFNKTSIYQSHCLMQGDIHSLVVGTLSPDRSSVFFRSIDQNQDWSSECATGCLESIAAIRLREAAQMTLCFVALADSVHMLGFDLGLLPDRLVLFKLSVLCADLPCYFLGGRRSRWFWTLKDLASSFVFRYRETSQYVWTAYFSLQKSCVRISLEWRYQHTCRDWPLH